jgi:hypothetical protein
MLVVIFALLAIELGPLGFMAWLEKGFADFRSHRQRFYAPPQSPNVLAMIVRWISEVPP